MLSDVMGVLSSVIGVLSSSLYSTPTATSNVKMAAPTCLCACADYQQKLVSLCRSNTP